MAAFLALTGCGSTGDVSHSTASHDSITPVVIDVRTPEEYARSHIAGTTNIPVAVLAERVAQVVPDKATPVAVHCQTGRRSAIAKEILQGKGYQVRDLGSYANAERVLAEGRIH